MKTGKRVLARRSYKLTVFEHQEVEQASALSDDQKAQPSLGEAIRVEVQKPSEYARLVVSGELAAVDMPEPSPANTRWQLFSSRLAFFLCLLSYELEGLIVPSLRLLLGGV